jgi:hypothetical protein
MFKVMLFLHIVGAVGMGIYAIMPFLVGKFKRLSGSAQEGLASGLVAAGRIGQIALVLQLLTGGYLISQGDYKPAWMITVIVLFLGIGALTGIVQAPLKRIAIAAAKGENASASISRVQTLSSLAFILFLVIIWIMEDPWYA